MGHELDVTPLQMVMAMSAIANGGMLMRPMLIDRVEDEPFLDRLPHRVGVERVVLPVVAEGPEVLQRLGFRGVVNAKYDRYALCLRCKAFAVSRSAMPCGLTLGPGASASKALTSVGVCRDDNRCASQAMVFDLPDPAEAITR